MKPIFFFTAFLYLLKVHSQNPIINNLDSVKIPQSIEYKGQLVKAFRWNDKLGDNIIIFNKIGEANKLSPSIYASHYIIVQNKPTLISKFEETISDCPEDLNLSFRPNSFKITDVNSDGLGEVWMMYLKSCHSDVSPLPLYLQMHEGKKTYKIEGVTRMIESKENKRYEFIGGDFQLDEAFESSDDFKQAAFQLWEKNVDLE